MRKDGIYENDTRFLAVPISEILESQDAAWDRKGLPCAAVPAICRWCKQHVSCCWDEVWQGQDYAESMVGLPTRVHRKPSTSSYDSCSSCSEQRNEGFNRMHVSTQVKSTWYQVLTVLMLGLQQTKKNRIGWSKRTAIAKQNAGLPHLSQPKPLLSLVASGGVPRRCDNSLDFRNELDDRLPPHGIQGWDPIKKLLGLVD